MYFAPRYVPRCRYPFLILVLVLTVLSLLFITTTARAEAPAGESVLQGGGEPGVPPGTDAREVLQAQVDSLPAGGGHWVIPPGRYEIDQPIVVSRGDILIQGSGSATHIVNRNENGEPALRIVSPEEKAYLWRVQVCDLRITGNPKSGAGIQVTRANELLLSRLSVEHNGGDGILMDHCYEDPRVCDSLMTYNAATGLNLLGCHDIVVSANQFEENMDGLHCIDGYNLTMTGNNLDDHLGNGVVIQNTYGSIVSANMIEECNGHAVILRGDCYGDAISANTLAHCKGEGVRIENARDITISANAFVLLADHSIHALNGAAQLTITGNTFSRYPFDPERSRKGDPGGGILLESARDVAISGNTFTATRQEAVEAAGDSNHRISITGNTVFNASSEAPGAFCAFFLENPTHCLVVNNIIHDEQQKEATSLPAVCLEGTGATAENAVHDNLISGYGNAGT